MGLLMGRVLVTVRGEEVVVRLTWTMRIMISKEMRWDNILNLKKMKNLNYSKLKTCSLLKNVVNEILYEVVHDIMSVGDFSFRQRSFPYDLNILRTIKRA